MRGQNQETKKWTVKRLCRNMDVPLGTQSHIETNAIILKNANQTCFIQITHPLLMEIRSVYRI